MKWLIRLLFLSLLVTIGAEYRTIRTQREEIARQQQKIIQLTPPSKETSAWFAQFGGKACTCP